MAAAPPLGFKVGARKIDCARYMPEPGQWEATRVLHEFKDGWKIVEDLTDHDRQEMAALTKTCVAGDSTLAWCYPANGGSKEQIQEAFIARKRESFLRMTDTGMSRKEFERYKKAQTEGVLDVPDWDYRTGREITKKVPFHTNQDYHKYTQFETYEAWLEAKWEQHKKALLSRPIPEPAVRLGHIEDKKGRPRACLYMVRLDFCAERPHYAGGPGYHTSNDLGQPGGVTIDGEKFRICEVRIGTGNAAPAHILPYAVAWYQHENNEWDQEAFEKVRPPQYKAFNAQRPKKKEAVGAGV